MEPITQPTDHSTESLGNPKRRRLWWLAALFGVLAIIVVGGVTVLAGGQTQSFAFLKETRNFQAGESINRSPGGTENYNSFATYGSPKDLADLTTETAKELTDAKWTKSLTKPGATIWQNPARDTSLIMSRDSSGTGIMMVTSRPANSLDKLRLWLKGLLGQQPQRRSIQRFSHP